MKRASLIIFMAFVLAFLIGGFAFADTYWVSPSGSATWADARGGTPLNGTAATSIATMNANISAGDTVYFRDGTYQFTSQYGAHILLSQKTNITLSSYAGESVVLKGEYGTRMWGINIEDSSFIKLHGLVFIDYSDYTIRAGSHHVEISHCVFRNDTSPYQGGGFEMVELSMGGQTVDQPVSHIWIHHSVFYRLAAGGINCTSEGGDALRIGYPSNTTQGGTYAQGLNSHITIEYNYLAYAGHAVFDNYGIYTVVRNNVSHNEPWYPMNPGACSPLHPAVYTNPSYNGLYGHRNFHITDTYARDKSYNLYEGNRLGHAGVNPNNDGATNLAIGAPGNIVRYNALYNGMHNNMNTKWGVDSGWQTNGGSRNRIYNNTLYRSGYGYPAFEAAYPWPKALKGFRYYVASSSPDNSFVNNIVYRSYAGLHGEDDIQASSSTPESYEFNNWTTNDGHGSSGFGDPLFVNPDLTQTDSTTLPDLHLQSNSPAIDGGVHLTTAVGGSSGSTSLVVGNAFYFQDGTWGAEMANHEADWIAVGTVSNTVQIASIDYDSNTIYLADTTNWIDGAKVWLYRKSDGEQILFGSAPDYGAYEFSGSVMSPVPSGIRVGQ